MKKRRIKIEAYDGYRNMHRIFAIGRILEEKSIVEFGHISIWQVVLNSWFRIRSKELPLQKIEISIGNKVEQIQTNQEGYYKISLDYVPANVEEFKVKINSQVVPDGFAEMTYETKCVLYNPQVEKTIVISDIDDTILQTNVLNKWKVLLNLIFTKVEKRKTIQYSSNWYRYLKSKQCAIFYVSNSPWNLYSYLKHFVRKNHFPEGPVLLRDFGLQSEDDVQNYKTHKKDEIERLISFYPNHKFILIGDGGERDAHIYFDINQTFSEHIKAIFIYRMGSIDKQLEIEKLFRNESKFYFIHSAKEGMEVCINKIENL